jgi:hypothetical protein
MLSRIAVLLTLTLSLQSNEATVEVEVIGAETHSPIPCRITIVNREGSLAPVVPAAGQRLAVRPGVVYTIDGKSRFSLPAGTYALYATRGFEYGLGIQKVSLAAGEERRVQLHLRREVPTSGLVSSDLHVHTATYSGHGDATADERAITLAGEGIEMAVIADHNYLADLTEPVARMGTARYVTTVIGNEVSTAAGHFNAFPFHPGSAVPDHKAPDWSTLMKSIRGIPGVQVITLNHPRDLHGKYRPFGPENFNPESGESRTGQEFSFDCLEVLNSGALQSDMMQTYRDWFALLNRGLRVTGIGGSDGHDVNRYIVGQGRTYISCPDEDPSHINVDQACQSLRNGRALVSMGLLTRMSLDTKFAAGDLATGVGDAVQISVSVLGPSWVRADTVQLYANGTQVREHRVTRPGTATPEKASVLWTLPRPTQDVYLVAIASGPGVTEPYWPIPKPYQPTSPVWTPRVFGSTNPIWLDADGDGKFTPPRAYAREILGKSGRDAARLLELLQPFDRATAVQAADLCDASGIDIRSPQWTKLLQSAPARLREGFAAFIRTLPPE